MTFTLALLATAFDPGALLAALAPLQPGPLATPLGKLLGAIVAIGVVVLVGRVLLSIAWKLVLVAAAVVGGLWLLTTFVGL